MFIKFFLHDAFLQVEPHETESELDLSALERIARYESLEVYGDHLGNTSCQDVSVEGLIAIMWELGNGLIVGCHGLEIGPDLPGYEELFEKLDTGERIILK